MNEEYLIHVKKAPARLSPILKLAKSLPKFKDKSRIENDKLVINGVRYGLDDLSRLPLESALYRVAKRSNDSYIAFQGELSPYSNFHHSPFQLDNI